MFPKNNTPNPLNIYDCRKFGKKPHGLEFLQLDYTMFDQSLEGIEKSLSIDSINKNPEDSLKRVLDTAPSLTKFFDNVLVMDEDEKLRQNRLNLLTRMKNIISGFANFSEI